MPNVIKQRQLSNDEKLTPKSDFMYGQSNHFIYNVDGSEKWTSSGGRGLHKSVGKGQGLRVDSRSAADEFVLELIEKKDATVISSITFDSYTQALTYFSTNDTFTFLGVPFRDQGNTDRYVIILYANTEGNYTTSLLNIDKWEITSSVGNSSGIFYDYVFDGVDKVYAIYTGGGYIQKYTLGYEDGNVVITNSSSLLDSDGSTIPATRVYGMKDNTLWHNDGTTHQVFNLDTLEVETAFGAKSTTHIMNTEVQIYGYESGVIYIQLAGNNDQPRWALKDSLISSSMWLETNVGIPLLILDSRVSDTEVYVRYVMGRGGSENEGEFFIRVYETTINRETGGITHNRYTSPGITQSTLDIPLLENSFANSTNSYNVGKFYDYGLQKQWDDNNS